MQCKKCNTIIEENDKFCKNCGSSQVINDNKDIVNKNDKNKKLKFTIIRTFVIFLFSVISFIFLPDASSDMVFIIRTLLLVVGYILLSIVINKFINFKEYSNYMFSNFFSLILYSVLWIFAYETYSDLAGWSSYDSGHGALLLMIYNVCLIPITFIFNALMDLIFLKFNNKINVIIDKK